MSVPRPPRLPDDLREMLESSRLPWQIVIGKRHYKLLIRDRLVAILPKSSRPSSGAGIGIRAHKNLLANVRRAIKAQGAQDNG